MPNDGVSSICHRHKYLAVKLADAATGDYLALLQFPHRLAQLGVACLSDGEVSRQIFWLSLRAFLTYYSSIAENTSLTSWQTDTVK